MVTNDKLVSSAAPIWQPDPRVKTYQDRMKTEGHDPNLIVFDEVLTDADKQMLGVIQGGNWQQPGPADHLADQIAAARHDGTLTGPISSDFIRNLIASQKREIEIEARFGQEAKIPIPFAVLDKALNWIEQNARDAAAKILG